MRAGIVAAGIGGFVLAKRSIDKKRYENMKHREEVLIYTDQRRMASLPQLDVSKLKIVQDLEIEMMSDMYNKMTTACNKKCIPSKYRDPSLTKGESVCLDRCVAKYLDVHERIGRKLTQLSMQDEELIKQIQAEQ
ncbi:unnamed protein product, partial [Darwinula stevensoni]